jgi:stage II sporulation protein D
VYEEGTDYVLKGRGYGHGVGLAQDGAIKMSEKGFNYREILYFYYGDLELDAWHPSSLLP